MALHTPHTHPLHYMALRLGRGLFHTCSSALRSSFATISAFGEVEKKIATKLSEGLKGAQSITVKDTSGGCGSFYSIDVTASEFKGKPIVKQHQLVHAILKDEMTDWHGLNLTTKAP